MVVVVLLLAADAWAAPGASALVRGSLGEGALLLVRLGALQPALAAGCELGGVLQGDLVDADFMRRRSLPAQKCVSMTLRRASQFSPVSCLPVNCSCQAPPAGVPAAAVTACQACKGVGVSSRHAASVGGQSVTGSDGSCMASTAVRNPEPRCTSFMMPVTTTY